MRIWDIAIGLLKRLPWETIGEFFKKFVSHRKRVTISSILLLVSAVALLAWYYKRSQDYSDIVNATLHAKLEPTAQTYKGLEAFLMTKVDKTASQRLADSNLSTSFLETYTKLV